VRVSTAGTLCLPVKQRVREIERKRERNRARGGGAGGGGGEGDGRISLMFQPWLYLLALGPNDRGALRTPEEASLRGPEVRICPDDISKNSSLGNCTKTAGKWQKCRDTHRKIHMYFVTSVLYQIIFIPSNTEKPDTDSNVGLRVEFSLKTECGYLRDAEVT